MQESLSKAIESKSPLLSDFQDTKYSYKIVVIDQNSSSDQKDQNATAEQEENMVVAEKAEILFELVMAFTVTTTLIVWCFTLIRSRRRIRNFKHPPEEKKGIVNQLPHQLEDKTTKKRKTNKKLKL